MVFHRRSGVRRVVCFYAHRYGGVGVHPKQFFLIVLESIIGFDCHGGASASVMALLGILAPAPTI
jgi:hypothetical protein